MIWHIFPPGTKQNGHAYREMLRRRFFKRDVFDFEKDVYSQDGASIHTSNATIDFIQEFTSNLISKNNHRIPNCAHPAWPACSPDKNPLDFGIWPNFRKLLFRTPRPTNRVTWIRRIHDSFIITIENVETINKMTLSVTSHYRLSIEAAGGHFELKK